MKINKGVIFLRNLKDDEILSSANCDPEDPATDDPAARLPAKEIKGICTQWSKQAKLLYNSKVEEFNATRNQHVDSAFDICKPLLNSLLKSSNMDHLWQTLKL